VPVYTGGIVFLLGNGLNRTKGKKMNATVEIVKLTSTCWSTTDGEFDIKKVAPSIFGVRKIEGNEVVALVGCFQTFQEAVACLEKVGA
jgi:hypothetical protein